MKHPFASRNAAIARAATRTILASVALILPCAVARAQQLPDPNEAYRVLMERRAEMSRRAVEETRRRRFEEGKAEGPFPSDANKASAKPAAVRAVSPEERKALSHTEKGVGHFSKNRFEQALAEYDEAIRIYPALASAHSNRGSALFALGRFTEAAEAFRRATVIDPKFGQAFFNLALVYIKLGREGEANDALLSAVRAYVASGDEHLSSGRFAEAEESYKAVLQIDPDYALAHLMLGVVYNDAGRHAEAVEPITRALRKHPNSADAHEAQADAYFGLRRYAEAAASAERAVALRPRSPGALYIAGLARASLGQREQALAHLERLRQLNANDSAKLLAEFIEKKLPAKR